MAGEIDPEFTTVHLPDGLSPDEAEAIRMAVAAGGPTFFPRHRWFGDKAREITESSIVAICYAKHSGDAHLPLVLTVIEISFADSGRERYFVPLTILPDGLPSGQTLAVLETTDGQTSFVEDAVARPEFHQWLLDPVSKSEGISASAGRIIWRPGPGYDAKQSGLDIAVSRVSGAEQSNSAVIFGTDLLAKVFRKLRPGLNPDIEISRFLSAQNEFKNYPELLGDLAYEMAEGSPYSSG